MNEDWFELAIIAFICLGIGVAVWRGGQANPEGTGTLGKKLSKLEGDVRAVRGEVKAVSGKVDTIERQVDDIDARAAKASDIERLERQVAAMGQQLAEQSEHHARLAEGVAAIREAGEQRGKQLDRLYDFIVQRGMSS